MSPTTAASASPDSTPTSQATTVPGDDALALKMARDNNAQRLAELAKSAEQPPTTPQHAVRKFNSDDQLGLRRVGSNPILDPDRSNGTKPDSSHALAVVPAKQTAPKAIAKKKALSNKKTPKKSLSKKKTLKTTKQRKKPGKKGKKVKKTGLKPKSTQMSQAPPAPSASQPPTKVESAAKLEQASQKLEPPVTPATVKYPPQHIPVATPVRTAGPEPTTEASPADMYFLLNRASTQEQLTLPAPGLSSDPLESETSGKPLKKRDPVLHARKMKFFRSLESRSLKLLKSLGAWRMYCSVG